MEELHVPLDPDGFSRRECPRCRAQFKVRWSAREARVVAAAVTGRVEHVNRGEEEAAGTRFCPYCACAAPADGFWPPEVRQHLDAAGRRLDASVRWHRLRLPSEWLRANPNVGAVAAAPLDAPVPIHPDRRDDLRRIALPCCGEEQKVSDAWLGPIRCHLCGVAHLRAGPRDIGLELALLKQWAGDPA